MNNLHADLIADAQRYISRQLNGFDMSDFTTTEQLAPLVSNTYAGGWAGFVSDFEQSQQRAMRALVARSDTPLQRWARLSRMIHAPSHFHLRPHDEVLKVDIGETVHKTLVRRAKVRESARRDEVTFTTELTVFTDNGTEYEIQSIEVPDEESLTFHKFGDLPDATERMNQRSWENMAHRWPEGHPSQRPQNAR